MKKSKNIIVIIGTTLVLAAGFMLPHAITAVQSGHMEAKTEQYEIEDIRISLTDQLTEGLRILGMGYTQVMLEKGENLTKEEAYTKGEEAIRYLKESELECIPEEAEAVRGIKPFLAVSSDQTITSIVWSFDIIYEDGRSSTFIIDDRTGKMLSFRCDLFGATSYRISEASEDSLKLIADAAARYYGFTLTGMERLNQSETNLAGYGDNLTALAVLRDENGKELTLPISAGNGMISFNFNNQNFDITTME